MKTRFLRRWMLLILAAFCLLTGLFCMESDAVLAEDEGLEAQASGYVTVYRLYSPDTGEHLYTTDANEKDTLYREYGWGYEGVGWYSPSSGTPVYRLYHPSFKNHLYTVDTNEVKVLTSKYGWKKDNGGKPLFYSGGSVKIYRLYNKNMSGMHHLTTDSNEYSTIPKYGWKQEGVKLYAAKVGSPITTQYYPTLRDGIYTTGKGNEALIVYPNSDGTKRCIATIFNGETQYRFIYKKGKTTYTARALAIRGTGETVTIKFSTMTPTNVSFSIDGTGGFNYKYVGTSYYYDGYNRINYSKYQNDYSNYPSS